MPPAPQPARRARPRRRRPPPAEALLLAGGDQGLIELQQVAAAPEQGGGPAAVSARRLAHAPAHSAGVAHIATCGATNHSASCSSDGQIASWDVVAGGLQLAGRFTAHQGPVNAVACSPSSSTSLASAGQDGQARLWDLRSSARCGGAALGAPGCSVCWAGEWELVAGDGLGRLQLLDARQLGAPALAMLQRHGDRVAALDCCGAAARQVLSAGDDGAALRTEVRGRELLAAGSPACGASGSFLRAACWLSPREVLLGNWDGLVWCAPV